jgi:hypothetical protein
VILFGAGASHLEGGINRPPLGANLYLALKHDFINSWGAISSKYDSAFVDKFEDGMDQYLSDDPKNLVELQRDLAIFICRFWKPRGDEPYTFLVKQYKHQILKNELSLSTINYDYLLEQAAHDCGVELSYESIQTSSSETARLLKLHGSCNFIFDDSTIKAYDKVEMGVDSHIEFQQGPGFYPVHPTRVRAILKTNKFPPVIALYSKEKDLLTSKKRIMEYQDEYKLQVMNAKSVLVVGARPNQYDGHIWNPIKGMNGSFAFVGGRNDYDSWISVNRAGKDNLYLPGKFQDRECMKLIIQHLDEICEITKK